MKIVTEIFDESKRKIIGRMTLPCLCIRDYLEIQNI